MNRRKFIQNSMWMGLSGAAVLKNGGLNAQSAAADAVRDDDSGLKITAVKTFGVTVDPNSDRPYVFVKIETNEGVYGWGEATLEGKAGAAMAAVHDLSELLVGKNPMMVEHLWQSMYVHSFYRAGPVVGSAISGIDHALWDIRGKVLNQPVYRLLGGPMDARGVRGYYHARANTPAEMRELRDKADELGVTAFKSGIPGAYEWIATNEAIDRAVTKIAQLREGLGDKIDIGIDFHAKTSPAVAKIICKEVEPLNLMFIEEACPPENKAAMARIARETTVPIATGERLVASFDCRELVEEGIVDIVQTDIVHTGGITALWKISALCESAGVLMAPHACEGPIGGLATLHVDASIPNFLVQEVCSGIEPGTKEKIWEEWFGFPAMRMVNGYFPLSDKPGLGFELTEEDLKKYPFLGTRAMPQLWHEDDSVAAW